MLLNLMAIDESFDFKVEGKTYRCWKRPEMIQQRPKLNRDKGTFTMQNVVVAPSIVIRPIKDRT